MFKVFFMAVVLSSTTLFALSLSQVEKASPKELGCIKGIGVKKFQNIVDYEKNNRLKSVDDLLNVRGVGKVILKNIKEDVIKKACLKSKPKKMTTEKPKRKKKKIGAE